MTEVQKSNNNKKHEESREEAKAGEPHEESRKEARAEEQHEESENEVKSEEQDPERSNEAKAEVSNKITSGGSNKEGPKWWNTQISFIYHIERRKERDRERIGCALFS